MRLFFIASVLLFFTLSCSNTTKDSNTNEPIVLEKESVSSGVVNDTLPLNYKIGMTSKDVFKHSNQLVAENKVMLNKDSSWNTILRCCCPRLFNFASDIESTYTGNDALNSVA